MPEAQKTIFLAIRDHKHGLDQSAHTTLKGAENQLAKWARQALHIWDDFDGYCDWTDECLVENWGEITGYTEYLLTDMLQLKEDSQLGS